MTVVFFFDSFMIAVFPLLALGLGYYGFIRFESIMASGIKGNELQPL